MRNSVQILIGSLVCLFAVFCLTNPVDNDTLPFDRQIPVYKGTPADFQPAASMLPLLGLTSPAGTKTESAPIAATATLPHSSSPYRVHTHRIHTSQGGTQTAQPYNAPSDYRPVYDHTISLTDFLLTLPPSVRTFQERLSPEIATDNPAALTKRALPGGGSITDSDKDNTAAVTPLHADLGVYILLLALLAAYALKKHHQHFN